MSPNHEIEADLIQGYRDITFIDANYLTNDHLSMVYLALCCLGAAESH